MEKKPARPTADSANKKKPVCADRKNAGRTAAKNTPCQPISNGNAKGEKKSSQKDVEPVSKNKKKVEKAQCGPDGAQDMEKMEYIVDMRRKLNREIFEKCLEKKMLQDMDLWET